MRQSSFSQFVQSWQKYLTTAKIKVTSSGAQADATDYYWFRSPVPNQMS